MKRKLLMIVLFLTGCAAQLPPSPEDIQAKRFESVPGKAVIYIVRNTVDSIHHSSLSLDGLATITTHPGTYYRWEVNPGTHRITGFAGSNELLTLQAEAGRLYFVQHTVFGTVRSGPQVSYVQQISERDGRLLVNRAQLL
jgi:hypothetical protein